MEVGTVELPEGTMNGEGCHEKYWVTKSTILYNVQLSDCITESFIYISALVILVCKL